MWIFHIKMFLIIFFLYCQQNVFQFWVFNLSCEHLIQWSFDFMGWSPSPPKIGALGLAEEDILQGLTRLSNQRVMWLHGWLFVTIRHYPAKSGDVSLAQEEIYSKECLTIYQHPAKFGDQTSSGGWNFLFIVCHVTSVDQVARETFDFMGAFTSP